MIWLWCLLPHWWPGLICLIGWLGRSPLPSSLSDVLPSWSCPLCWSVCQSVKEDDLLPVEEEWPSVKDVGEAIHPRPTEPPNKLSRKFSNKQTEGKISVTRASECVKKNNHDSCQLHQTSNLKSLPHQDSFQARKQKILQFSYRLKFYGFQKHKPWVGLEGEHTDVHM